MTTEEGRKFSKALRRRLSRCPECDAWLVWAPSPWRAVNGGGLAFAVLALAVAFVRNDTVLGIAALLMVPAIALFVWGAVKQSLVPFQSGMTIKDDAP
jgi:hypothetical protein